MLSTDVSHCSTSRSVLQYSPWRTAVLLYPYCQYAYCLPSKVLVVDPIAFVF